MKMRTGKEGRQLTCEVWAARNMIIQPGIPVGMEPDTVGYAVCRFLPKCEILCRDYVEQSYRLRLAKGRKRRPVISWFTVPARMLELPGGVVKATVAIFPEGVEVRSVVLGTPGLPQKACRSGKKRPEIRVFRSAS